MKKLILFSASVLAIQFVQAQSLIWKQSISKTNINVRGAAVVLAKQQITAPEPGSVIVHFDGQAYASTGDRIVLAASNIPDWGVNDGSVGIEVAGAAVSAPFSHSRVYDVAAGTQTFYAVAENYVEQAGSGITSVYGNLTVEFIPRSSGAFVRRVNISKTNISLRTVNKVLASQSIVAPVNGTVEVNFDGKVISTPGDRVVLAASNTTTWGVNDGNVGVEAYNLDVNANSFSHTRVYPVTAGLRTFYAIGDNYVETAGTGIASVYATLIVKYLPYNYTSFIVHEIINTTNLYIRGSTKVVAKVTVTTTKPGQVALRFDGQAIGSVGDRIVLAASNTPNWGVNDGNVAVKARSADVNGNSFSHSRLYSVGAGSTTFYAVAQNYVDVSGTGYASIYGKLTAQFFPITYFAVAALDLAEAPATVDLFPNPVAESFEISASESFGALKEVTITDKFGKVFKTFANPSGPLETGDLPTGIYNAIVVFESHKEVKKFIKK